MPGQAPNTATVYLGYGKSRGGSLERGIGYDANVLRGTSNEWIVAAKLLRTAGRTKLATSQYHFALDGNEFVRVVSRREADVPQRPRPTETLYPERPAGLPAWGMSIDLDRCIGCNACVIACQAENNVPVVGKDQVAVGREMHWLRVDRYHEGPVEDPAFYFQPVPCMHCEHAPCEMGCPVGATTHSPDGLNQMIYNRCIGTRTCSSYCPYKVRRFNWYDYTSDAEPGLRAQRNPDVTVRMRGVMEKCTYCIQRINAARIAAEKEQRPIRDGEVVPACQAACPTEVIVFGDVADSDSAVTQTKADPRNYSLLGELNTRPRTTYLARIVDPKSKTPRPS
jgi:molybdopterin-containing oxidoreductase family iron-sulfur binding subunit